MSKLNSSYNHPFKFVLEDGTTIGQFYNSWDKKYHFAEYIPYVRPPSKYLCGGTGNFCPATPRIDGGKQSIPICILCFNKLKYLNLAFDLDNFKKEYKYDLL